MVTDNFLPEISATPARPVGLRVAQKHKVFLCSRQESNLHQRLRRALLYPLSYESVRAKGLEPLASSV